MILQLEGKPISHQIFWVKYSLIVVHSLLLYIVNSLSLYSDLGNLIIIAYKILHRHIYMQRYCKIVYIFVKCYV